MDKYKLPCLHAKCKNLLTTAQKYNNTHTYKETEESSGNYLYISHLKVQYLLEFARILGWQPYLSSNPAIHQDSSHFVPWLKSI